MDGLLLPTSTRRSYAELMDEHSFTPPAWRWERARQLATDPNAATGWEDDGPTRAAAALFRARAHGEEPQVDQHLAAAHEIFAENTLTRWKLEAYLLTRLKSRAIARRLAIAEEVVTIYESVFFCVRERMKRRRLQMEVILSYWPGCGFAGDLPGLWRFYAFMSRRAEIVDHVIAATTGEGRERYSDELMALVEQALAIRMRPIIEPVEDDESVGDVTSAI